MNISNHGNIISLGEKYSCGTYILKINIFQDKKVVFGRFDQGKEQYLTKGEYIYIGSALSNKGATSLGNRLQRHTLRSSHQPHQINNELTSFFDELHINYTKNPSPKKLRWNIDYLLELVESEINKILFIRSSTRYESIWSNYIENLTYISVLQRGLGASDSKNETHILVWNGEIDNWNYLIHELNKLI
ncbi:MAG: DUF123 domain-containing protein [Candidatus Heimdallarchaeota archaeon]|nr:DUF123 domain-containing protein [Candidatus Heimdallarchaeota archaeon]